MKPFDLEKALKGVTTMDKKQQLHLFDINDDEYPLYGVVHEDYVECFTKQGRVYVGSGDSSTDLFMKTEKKVGYVLAEHIIKVPCVVDDWVKVEYEE